MTMAEFEVAAYQHPLTGRAVTSRAPEGRTIAELVRDSGIDKRFMADVQVVISRGLNSSVVPMDQWSRLRPKEGSHVLIGPKVHGAAGLLLAAALPTAATSIVSAIGLTGIAASVAYAAITIVGSLLVNALIAPPSPQDPDSPDGRQFYTITGSSNALNPYGVFPTVLGRHLIYPPKTGKGYTEGEQDNIRFRGRYTFGHGPIALETLKIGTTDIWDFAGIEVEFLNVDQTETLARIPQLASITRAWRTGSQRMTLYPDDVTEDSYSVRLFTNSSVIRNTRTRTESVSIDVTFQGLINIEKDGTILSKEVDIEYAYRPTSGGSWTVWATRTHRAKTQQSIRFTENFDFPSDGEWEVRVTRTSSDTSDQGQQDDAYLTAIRSVRTGDIPSNPDMAEIAIRIRASEQINGQIDTLNAIALQMGPVWDGSAWSAFQPIRHPAWVKARALMGPMVRDAVAAERLDLDDLLAWATEEPHWTCDTVIDQPTTVADVLDLICATGRARRTMRDLKFSVIRDGGAGQVVQQFSPRNSWGFSGQINFPREIHGFRVRFISEEKDWQQDEVVVYADGYDESNATEFETLELVGVVVSGSSQSNAWRLGRYHLAQAILRPETYTWNCGIDHLRVNMGDKVRFVHDVPLIGVGSGRIRSFTTHGDGSIATFVLDEFLSLAGSSYRVTIRQATGDTLIFEATPPASLDGIWDVALGVSGDASGVAVGDLVLVEEMTIESMEVLVTSIRHSGDLTATISGVPAAPEVLDADQGEIPAYVPNISIVEPREEFLPNRPEIASANPEVRYGPARVVLPIEISQHDPFTTVWYYVSLTDPSGEVTSYGPYNEETFDIPLDSFGSYQVEVRRENTSGEVSPPNTFFVQWSVELTQPVNVTSFAADVVGQHVTLTWTADDPLVKHYEVRHLPVGNTGGWSAASPLAPEVLGGTATVPLLSGSYLIRGVGHWDQLSPDTIAVSVDDANAFGLNVVRELVEFPDFPGDKTTNLLAWNGILYLGSDNGISTWAALSDVDRLSTFGGVAPIGEYQFEETFDLGAVYTSRLSADVQGNGVLPGFTISTWPSLSSVASISGDVDESLWSVTLQMRTTNDDPAGSPTWTDWQTFRAGNHSARAFQFKVVLESFDTSVQLIVSRLSVLIDMPDRIAGGDDIICPAEGLRIAFTPAFKERPAINVTGEALPSGVVARITNQDRTGFDIQFVDALDAGSEETFDWVAKGFGREN